MSSAQLVFKRYETKYLLDAEHPAYKEKIRTRCYGTPHPFDPVFVELKKKCDGVVYKRRCELAPADAGELLAGRGRPQSQVERELDWTCRRCEGLAPCVYLAYDRAASTESEVGVDHLILVTDIVTDRDLVQLSDHSRACRKQGLADAFGRDAERACDQRLVRRGRRILHRRRRVEQVRPGHQRHRGPRGVERGGPRIV